MRYEEIEPGVQNEIPETVLESVECLENFLNVSLGSKYFNEEFLRNHFLVCKNQIKKIQKEHIDKMDGYCNEALTGMKEAHKKTDFYSKEFDKKIKEILDNLR